MSATVMMWAGKMVAVWFTGFCCGSVPRLIKHMFENAAR